MFPPQLMNITKCLCKSMRVARSSLADAGSFRPLVALGAGFLLPAQLVFGASYFVAADGEDGNSGEIGSPLRTIQAAMDLTQAGDTIEIRSGIYRELVRPRPANKGAAGNPITMRAYDPDGAGPLLPEEVTISGFEPVEPGENGAGQWIDLGDGSGIWKLQLTPNHGVRSTRLNQVLYNGEVLRRERFPSASRPLDFDYRTMARAEVGSRVLEVVTTIPAVYTATYKLSDLPPGDWTSARLFSCAGLGYNLDHGTVLSQDPDSITFSYPIVSLHNHASEADPFFLYNSILALDEPGEAFYDVEGVSGLSHTLYIIPPPGATPDQSLVELRSPRNHPGSGTESSNSAFWFTGGVEYVRVENLTVLGAGVFALDTASSHISFRGVTVLYGSLSGAAVSLASPECEFVDGRIEGCLGHGTLIGENGIFRNNVVSRVLKEAVVSIRAGTRVEQNTIHEVGGVGISLTSDGGTVKHNNVFQCALLLADIAAMNSCSQGDLGGLEIAYNFVHTCPGRYDTSHGWGGCFGIRLDGGCGLDGVSNYLIHHNMVCGVSSPYDLAVWALKEGAPNYGNALGRIYNNTVEGIFALTGDGSLAGTDVRNNAVGNFFARAEPQTTITTLEDNIIVLKSLAGNLTGSVGFVSPSLCNYLLKSDSVALDAGQDLGALTSGFLGSAPDLGAFEFGQNPWVAGALMSEHGIADLTVTQFLNFGCTREIRVEGMPPGRMLPHEFKLRIGNVSSTFFRHVFGADGHVSAAVIEIDTENLEGSQLISYSLDGTTFTSGGSIEMVDCSLGISAVTPRAASPIGGSLHTVEGGGLIGYHRPLIPIQFSNLAAQDLRTIPVPVIFDSEALIQSGALQADGRDLRVIEFPSISEDPPRVLEYWIESGLNTPTTLIWVRNPNGEGSIGPAVYLSFGDPAAIAQSDPAVLTDYFDEMALPSLELKLTADSLVGSLQTGDPVTSWPDLSGFGNDAQQADLAKAPVFERVAVSGLSGVKLDGIDDYLFIGSGIGPDNPVSTFIVYWNPDPGQNATQRLVSANHSPTRDWLTDLATGTRGLAMNATIGPVDDTAVAALAHFRSIGTFNFADFTIGAEYLYRDNPWWGSWYRGVVCEILVFSEMIAPNATPNHDHIREYLMRKWGMDGSARGIVDPAELIAPLEVLIDGQTANFDIVNGSIIFEAPPFSGSQLLPVSADVEIRKGGESEILSDSFFYFLSSYPSWEGAPPLNIDADGDGHTSLFEYAYGGDPASPDDAIGPIFDFLADDEGGRREFQLRRNINATDLMMWIEFSEDLESWIRVPISDATTRIVDPDVTGDGSTQLVGVELPFGPGVARQFARLVVELIQ